MLNFLLAAITLFSSCMVIAMQQYNPPREKCVICLEELYKKKTINVTLKCQHQFHPECIWKWANENIACPLCRKEATIHISKKHIEALDENIIKDIMQGQTFRIDDFSSLSPNEVKTILAITGLKYQDNTHTTNKTPPRILATQLRQQQERVRLEDVNLYKRTAVMVALRVIFILTIGACLVSIYPKNFTDELFIHKMITLCLSFFGLAITCWYPDEVDYLEEY
jgi:hypothetical protein